MQIIGDGRKKAAFISREDVAEVAVRAALTPKYDNVTLLMSAEALSYREVIAQLEEVIGRSIEIETLEPGQRLERMPAQARDIASELMTGLAHGPEMNFTTPEVAERFGIRFELVKEFLKANFAKPAPA